MVRVMVVYILPVLVAAGGSEYVRARQFDRATTKDVTMWLVVAAVAWMLVAAVKVPKG